MDFKQERAWQENCVNDNAADFDLLQMRLKWFRKYVTRQLWFYFVLCFTYPLIFTFISFINDKKLVETIVFSNVFPLCLCGILIVRIQNAFEYQKIWKSYIASGVVILLWSMYALYSSGYSFFVIFPLCVVIPCLLAYCFRGRFADIQVAYLAWSGYNILLFFLLFAFQFFVDLFFFLAHLGAFGWFIYSLGGAAGYLKRGDEKGLMDKSWHWSFSRPEFIVLMTTLYAIMGSDVAGAIAGIPQKPAALFDARFMFYAVMVCFFVEDFMFRLYTKMWDKLTKQKLGMSGRVIY